MPEPISVIIPARSEGETIAAVGGTCAAADVSGAGGYHEAPLEPSLRKGRTIERFGFSLKHQNTLND